MSLRAMISGLACLALLCLAVPRAAAKGIDSLPQASQAVERSIAPKATTPPRPHGRMTLALLNETAANDNAPEAPKLLGNAAVVSAQISRGEHQSLPLPNDMPDLRGGKTLNVSSLQAPHTPKDPNVSSLRDGSSSNAPLLATQKPKVTPAPQMMNSLASSAQHPMVRRPKSTPEPHRKRPPASSAKNSAGPKPVAATLASIAVPNFRKVELQDGTWDLTTSPFSSQADLQHLRAHLFSGYQKDLPPIPLDGGPLPIGIGIDFVKIKDLDEVQGSLDIALALRLCWDDARLSFDAHDFFNRSWIHEGDKLPLDPNVIWTPDITVLNLIGSVNSLSLSDSQASPLVLADDLFRDQTGVNVLWSRPLVVSSECNVDMADYPFDKQVCDIIVGSWTQSRRAMLLVPQQFFAEYTIHSSEFKVVNITVGKRDMYTKGSAQTFNEVVYRIVLQRYPHYHVINFILPMLSITLLTVATMWMNSKQSGQRVNSGTKLLLCVVSIMFITARGRPALHGDIWMDRFQSHCLALCLSSVSQSLFVDYVSLHAGHISWMPQVDTIDVVLRSMICFMTGFTVYRDAAEVNLSDAFDSSSATLLITFIYLIASALAFSSTFTIVWLLLPPFAKQKLQESRGGTGVCSIGSEDVPLLGLERM